jgi:recombination protein U
LTIRYPDGKPYIQNREKPTGQKRKPKHGNRGMTLEEDINRSNDYYLTNGVAVIHKKPTPVQIVDVNYPKRSAAIIKEAYFKTPSTTDYNGVYRGKYIDFEAKETKNKTSFPLQNFHLHQIDHIRGVLSQSGICFVLLRFSTLAEVYFLDANHLLYFWNVQNNGGRKSMKKSEIVQWGHFIPQGYRPRIDYLKVIDNIYFNDGDKGN